ncbi:MAG: hypothetical protein ACRDY3_11255 [Acidimicrobiales bacterium]
MSGDRALGPCLFCGEGAEERHHWTAALDPDGDYLDPAATIPLCVPCHHAEHAAWREQGIDRFADPLEARLVRLSWLWQRLADVAERYEAPTLDAHSVRGVQLVVLGAWVRTSPR